MLQMTLDNGVLASYQQCHFTPDYWRNYTVIGDAGRIENMGDGAGDQILLCTAGSGWYQADGEEPVSMEPGITIRVPAGTKHWHGAKADSWFSHVAFITPGENVSNEWLEPVEDEQYNTLPKNGENA